MMRYSIQRRHVLTAAGGLVLCAFSLAFLAIPHLEAGKKKRQDSADKVKVTATQGKSTSGKPVINIKVDIEKGWYIYANPVGNSTFASNATKVTVKSGGKKLPAKLIYPKGKIKKLGDFRFLIYSGSATIKAELEQPVDKSSTVVEVQVNSCSKKSGVCLRPGKKTVKLR